MKFNSYIFRASKIGSLESVQGLSVHFDVFDRAVRFYNFRFDLIFSVIHHLRKWNCRFCICRRKFKRILQSGRDDLATQVVNVIVRQANIHSQISAQKCVFHVSEIHISEISRRLLGSFLADFARIRRPLFDSISKICYTNPSRVFNNSILPEYRYIHVLSLLPICPKTGQV